MLEEVNAAKKISKEEYKKAVKPLRAELAALQQTVKEKGLPVVVLFEGWGASGKGRFISDMILTLDPRGYKVHAVGKMSDEEQRKPHLWRFWAKLPAKGKMAVFDRSWYQDVSVKRLEDQVDDEEGERRLSNINTFERQITAEGCLVVKYFLHISQEEQKRRLDELEEDESTAWRVSAHDRKRNRQYDLYYKAYDEMIEQTDTACAPWHVIPGGDRRGAMLQIYQILVNSIRYALGDADRCTAESKRESVPAEFTLVETPLLKDVSLRQKLNDKEYEQQLKELQGELKKLHDRVYRTKTPVIVVYEGWDAAGKGGNIRRVAEALDPRGYEVIPVAAPDETERAHHYLWRFWNNLPKSGHVAIFDRSWYGRVMVEKIEGFCTPEQVARAYQEINEFEKELQDWGAVIVKFWLHIDQDEQLKRFEARQSTPGKQWKITDEDWRNRSKWPQYEQAVNEMLQKTSTEFAPWNIIESQDKKYARIKALQILVAAIEQKLDAKR